MIASKESFEPHSSEALPNSTRVYIPGEIHSDVRVPMREIAVTPTKTYSGAIEPNAPSRALRSPPVPLNPHPPFRF